MKKSFLSNVFLSTFILLASVFYLIPNHAFATSEWTRQMGPGSFGWTPIKYSSDGTKIISSHNTGNVMISSDDGINWTNTGRLTGSGAIAASSDGTKIAVINTYDTKVYTSTT